MIKKDSFLVTKVRDLSGGMGSSLYRKEFVKIVKNVKGVTIYNNDISQGNTKPLSIRFFLSKPGDSKLVRVPTKDKKTKKKGQFSDVFTEFFLGSSDQLKYLENKNHISNDKFLGLIKLLEYEESLETGKPIRFDKY